MELYTHSQMLDAVIGERETPGREEYEDNLKSFLMGDEIKKLRLSKSLTQQQLGDIMGVKKAQISRIEKGHNLTLATIVRAFKALGVKATLELDGGEKIVLC